MPFSVNDLLSYYRCPRLLYLNNFGDKTLQTPPGDFLKKLWKMGKGYESNVIDFFQYEKPKYKIGDFETGYEKTIELMKKGIDTIYQGVLKNDELVGIPDFLIKAKGYSSLGDYYYYAVDIKGATVARERYLFQLACYSYLLGETQEFAPLYGGLLLLNFDLQIKYFYSTMQKVYSGIEKSTKIIKNPDEMPDLFIDSNCSMCQWYSFCLPEAKEKKDLSLLPGIKRETKEELKKLSINNYLDLVKCSEDDVNAIKDLEGNKGKNVLIQAKSIAENKIYIKSLPELNENDKEIFIDFESDFIFDDKGVDLERIDYLVGTLKFDGEKYIYNHLFYEDENAFLKSFSNYLELHKDHIFYHYGHYESSILNGKWDHLPKVELVNIEKIIKDSVVMPVTSYSLKNIAKALGFNWTNKDSSATQSMCWYSYYLETKDKKYLDLSIEYNEDDCRALCMIKNWLSKLKKENVTPGEFIEIGKISVS